MTAAIPRAMLIGDHDPTWRTTVCDSLTEEGYRVRDAPDGVVLNVLHEQRERFGLGSLDLMMQRTTGWQFRS